MAGGLRGLRPVLGGQAGFEQSRAAASGPPWFQIPGLFSGGFSLSCLLAEWSCLALCKRYVPPCPLPPPRLHCWPLPWKRSELFFSSLSTKLVNFTLWLKPVKMRLEAEKGSRS